MNNIKIFTHKDLDGIAGASLYLYCNNLEITNTDIVFIEPYQIRKYLRNKHLSNADKIVLIDLGLNSDSYNALASIDLRDIWIEWYDHHVWEREWINGLSARGVKLFIDATTCASGVVAKTLCNNAKAMEFADVVCDIDLWLFRRWESNFLYRYVEAEDSDFWRYKTLDTFLMTLRGTDLRWLIENIEKYVEDYVDRELDTLSKLCSKIYKVRINDIDIAIYTKHHRIPGTSIIGNYVLNRCGGDIAIVLNEELKSISFRSIRCNVRDIAKMLGGGGHVHASGAHLNVNLFQKTLYKVSRRLLIKYIVSKLKDLGILGVSICV